MAIFLARGGKSLTTWPPMRISPAVGSSSPAIIRRRVVFPHPDGPSRTRNSPSSVERSTPLTASTSPKCFVMFLVSTVAMRYPLLVSSAHYYAPTVRQRPNVEGGSLWGASFRRQPHYAW